MTVVSPPAHANGDITWACDADRRQKVPLWVCRSAAWLSVVCVKFHITAWSHGSAGLVLDITRAAVGWSKSSVAREWCRCQKSLLCMSWQDPFTERDSWCAIMTFLCFIDIFFFLSPTKYEGGKDIQLKNLNICNIIKQRSWVRADVAARFTVSVCVKLCAAYVSVSAPMTVLPHAASVSKGVDAWQCRAALRHHVTLLL